MTEFSIDQSHAYCKKIRNTETNTHMNTYIYATMKNTLPVAWVPLRRSHRTMKMKNGSRSSEENLKWHGFGKRIEIYTTTITSLSLGIFCGKN